MQSNSFWFPPVSEGKGIKLVLCICVSVCVFDVWVRNLVEGYTLTPFHQRLTHRHTQMDGTDLIPSTTDMGGNKVRAWPRVKVPHWSVNRPGSQVSANLRVQTQQLHAASRKLARVHHVHLHDFLSSCFTSWSSDCFSRRGESTHNFTHHPTQESESRLSEA